MGGRSNGESFDVLFSVCGEMGGLHVYVTSPVMCTLEEWWCGDMEFWGNVRLERLEFCDNSFLRSWGCSAVGKLNSREIEL